MFLDRNAKNFDYVLDYLRNGGVLPPLPTDEPELERVRREFDFFCIPCELTGVMCASVKGAPHGRELRVQESVFSLLCMLLISKECCTALSLHQLARGKLLTMAGTACICDGPNCASDRRLHASSSTEPPCS